MRTNKCRPCGESSPYWNWINERGFVEPDSLNPAPEPVRHNALLQSVLDAIDGGAEEVLTPRQRRAFQLVVREGISMRQAAKKMKITYGSIQDLIEAGAKKIRILALARQ